MVHTMLSSRRAINLCDQLDLRLGYRVSAKSTKLRLPRLTPLFKNRRQLSHWYLYKDAANVPCRPSHYTSHLVDEEVGGLYQHDQIIGSDEGF